VLKIDAEYDLVVYCYLLHLLISVSFFFPFHSILLLNNSWIYKDHTF